MNEPAWASRANCSESGLAEAGEANPRTEATVRAAGANAVVPATTMIAVTAIILVVSELIGTANRSVAAVKMLVKRLKRPFDVLVWISVLFMYMKVRTRPFPVSRPFVCP